jgi:hypothetical protein
MHQVRYCLAVARTRNFMRAAEEELVLAMAKDRRLAGRNAIGADQAGARRRPRAEPAGLSLRRRRPPAFPVAEAFLKLARARDWLARGR